MFVLPALRFPVEPLAHECAHKWRLRFHALRSISSKPIFSCNCFTSYGWTTYCWSA